MDKNESKLKRTIIKIYKLITVNDNDNDNGTTNTRKAMENQIEKK